MPRRRCDASTPACRTEVVNGQQGQRKAGKGKERTDEVDGRDDSFGIQLCQLKDYNCVICFIDTHTQAADAQPSRRDQLSGLAWQ